MKNKITQSLLVVAISALTTLNASSQTINTIVGNGTQGYTGDGGQATACELGQPWGVAVDGSGNLFIADYTNNVIRKVDGSGVITTVIGNGTAGYAGDSGQASAAEINNPGGVAVDASGNIYFTDNGNNVVRKVNTSGIITTIAGNGTIGYSGDGGPATAAQLALFNTGKPTVDGAGNVYIPDDVNNVVRIVNTSGIINTYAGNGTAGYTGDGGPATAAELNQPCYVAIDQAGNIYIADFSNYAIRKVDLSGNISTAVGTGTNGYTGDGGPATAAEMSYADGVATDVSGNIYVADGNYVIRQVNALGIVNTIAGNGTAGYTGDGGPATAAEIGWPYDVATDAGGNVYISDGDNYVMRKVSSLITGTNKISYLDNGASFYPNPCTSFININIGTDGPATVDLFNMMGQNMGTWKMEKGVHTLNTQGIAAGAYMLQVKIENGVSNKKLIKM